jgi:hypothetical protein
MSGDRHDVDSEIELPAGMELVVPPAASSTIPAAGADRGAPDFEASGAQRPRGTDGAARDGLRRPPTA